MRSVPCLLVAALVVSCGPRAVQDEDAVEVAIPRTWTDEAMASFELPLATPEFSPKHLPESYYYALPVRPIYRSYPVYHPDYEPEGYLDELQQKEPEVVFDETALESEADWVAAGELVFKAPISYAPVVMEMEHARTASWYRDVGVPVTADGILPFVTYVVRERGKVELGQLACAMCHTRVMPDGTIIAGAQGNFPFDPAFAHAIETIPPLREIGPRVMRRIVAAPWVEEARERLAAMSADDIVAALRAVPVGAVVRQGTSLHYPARVPELIGIRERKYLDATGFVLHRSPADIMRYAAVNQTLDMLANYGGYVPAAPDTEQIPPPGESQFAGTESRYSDPQLYALAMYLYSLEPPQNPNEKDERARQGEAIFTREACALCHTPPEYTNNALIPAQGFEPPEDHWNKYDILDLDIEVGTGPHLALQTRRGTGYYKVPSLKGLWYRTALQHNGAVSSLEEWFDPERLDRGVQGHEFGLTLTPDERETLIAFLRTL